MPKILTWIGLVLFALQFGCGEVSAVSEESGEEGIGEATDSSMLAARRRKPPPPPPPTTTFSTEFATNSGFAVDSRIPGGYAEFGAPESGAGDGLVAALHYPGIPSNTSSDMTSPAYAEQIRTTQQFGYGTYTYRVKLPSCLPSEGLVNGLFTYWNNGSDLNGNGMIDNSELDVEVLCAEPNIIYLTIWTDYTDDEHFSKVTRLLDVTTGEYYQTSPGQEKNNWGLNSYGLWKDSSGRLVSIPDFSAVEEWITFKVVWRSTSVSYSMNYRGTEYALWTYSDPAHIPSHAAPMMFNLWHNAIDWDTDQPVDFPASDSTMLIDWFSYAP